MSKKCPTCKTIKDLSEYGVRRERNNLPKALCRQCEKAAIKKYQRSKKGVSGVIYLSQKLHSKRRGHSGPTYSKAELREWLYSQKKFHLLYDNWKRLDYQKNYKPSVDRIDDDLGYTISNIQLVTWRENNLKDNAGRFRVGRNMVS